MDIGKYYRVGDVPENIDSFHCGYDWQGRLFVGGAWDQCVEECAEDAVGAVRCDYGVIIEWDRVNGLLNSHRIAHVSPVSDVEAVPEDETDWNPSAWHGHCWFCSWDGPSRDSEEQAHYDCLRHSDDPRLFSGDRTPTQGWWQSSDGQRKFLGYGSTLPGTGLTWTRPSP